MIKMDVISKIPKRVRNVATTSHNARHAIKTVFSNSSSIVSLTQSWKCCKCKVENYNDKWQCSYCRHERCKNCKDLLG